MDIGKRKGWEREKGRTVNRDRGLIVAERYLPWVGLAPKPEVL